MGEVIPVISTKIENNKCPWEVTSLYSFHYFCCPDQGNLLRGIDNGEFKFVYSCPLTKNRS